MATYISVINQVLRKLRESTVAAPTSSTYSTLIGDFVNESRREVEDAWKWGALRTTLDVTTSNGTAEYSITGAGERWKYEHPTMSVYNETLEEYLQQRTPRWMKREAIRNTDVDRPFYYYFTGQDSSGDQKVTFHQTPGAVYTIGFNLIVPQTDMSTGSEVFSVPFQPVMLGAYAKALEERGEDNGTISDRAAQKYNMSLSDAIAIDASIYSEETTWDAGQMEPYNWNV